MRTIKEYPFDFSDLREEDGEETKKSKIKAGSKPQEDKKQKVLKNSNGTGKMADEASKSSRKTSEVDAARKPKTSVTSSDRIKKISVDNPQSILCNPLDSESRRVSRERKVSNIERKVSILASDQDKENIANERNGRVSCHQAEGPSRKKSNLHNNILNEIDNSWDRHSHIEGKYKKYSTTSTVYSKKALSQQSEQQESRSWWYACCQKCHQEEAGLPSWEPPHWQKVCPYPFCPTFRNFARLLTVCVIGLLVWLTMALLMGKPAAPGGQLFTLVVLTLSAHLGGVIMSKVTKLPGLLGMLLVGVILKNVGFINFDKDYLVVAAFIRKIALTILLIRAGLDMDPHAMKKHFFTVIKLSIVPWTFEFAVFSVLAYFFLGLPWDWAFLLGAIIAAVSPAVIVACLIRLRKKGYGVSKGIPTLVLAVSGIDDAVSVAAFGLIFSIMFTNSSLTMTIIQGPLSVIVGIGSGVVLGYFIKYVPERNDAFLVPLRVLFLLFGGIFCMLGFEEIGWGGAGPLAAITFAFFAYKNWTDLGWDLEDNPAMTAFEIFWMFFEPMLFALTGTQVVIADLKPHLVLIGSAILLGCMISRGIITSTFAIRSNLNLKEKVFVGLSWMAKATVQAALGPVALDEVRKLSAVGTVPPHFFEYAETVVTLCVLSIMITAPIGAITITFAGPKLLSRTTKPPILEENQSSNLNRSYSWRRSNRPSIRDISIIDEDEVAERDAEMPQNTRPESPLSRDVPPITTQPNSQTP